AAQADLPARVVLGRRRRRGGGDRRRRRRRRRAGQDGARPGAVDGLARSRAVKRAALVLAAATLAAGCEDVRSCRQQTLLLAFDYSGAAGADQVDVDVTAADGDHADMIYPVSGAAGTLEVTFKSGYPVGQQVDVVATALKGGVAVAEASASTRPPAGCARVE